MSRRLTRDPQNAWLGGVAAGFAGYFDVDPVLVRLGFILLCFLNGVGILFYVICWILMPRKGEAGGSGSPDPSPANRIVDEVRAAGEKVVEGLRSSHRPGRGHLIAGVILIFLGLLFLVDRLPWLYWPTWLHLANLWPLILIAIGLAMILGAGRGKEA